MTTLTDHIREIRYATRRLAAAPAFAIASVVILALTLGVGTALFSVINSMLLRPMAFEERSGVVRVSWGERGQDRVGAVLPAPVARQLVFDRGFTSVQLAGFTRKDLTVSIGGQNRVVLVEAVAGSYFEIVEATALSGRLLRHEDTDPATHPVAVISERLWRATRTGGTDSGGEPIVVGGKPAIVVGVVGGAFQGLALRGVVTDVWLPAQDRTIGHVFGRLRNRATATQADAEIKGRVSPAGLDARYAEFVIGIREGLLGALPVVGYLAGAASFALCGVVVLVAGASVTNLFLARTFGRRAEIAVRLVLGAGERDIRQLVSREVWLIALAAGVLSIGSAILTVRLVLDMLVRSDRVALNLAPDWRILTYAALGAFSIVVVISRILVGHASQIDALATMTASAGAGGNTAQSDGARRKLLAVQVGGSTMLLILAALLIRSASTGLSYPPGFNPVGAAIGWIDHRSQGHDAERARTVERRLLEVARGTSGAASVAIASTLPVDGGLAVSVIADSGSQPLRASLSGVSTQFFGAFGLGLRRGRDFSEPEVAGKLPVAVLSESAATALWPSRDTAGRTFRMADFSRLERDWIEYVVIGVAADAPAASGRSDARRIVFVPYGHPVLSRFALLARARGAPERFALLVRAHGRPERSLPLLRGAVAAGGDHLALQKPGMLEDAIALSRVERRMSGTLLTAIGFLAAGIALVGIYGLASHNVSRRHREFGVLIALGATSRALFVNLAAETAGTLARGAAYGIAASVPGAFILRRYVWDLEPFDWLAVLAVPAALIAVGLLAAGLPLAAVIRRPVADLLKTS